MPRPRRLVLDVLEDRTVPVVWNNPWADPGNLTISFASDGTPIEGAPSQLYQELGPSTSAWQQTILKAFQAWGSQANINVTVVPDDGSPFGVPGPIQGSDHHGDIRIGARSLGSTALAITTPFDLFSGWSGDVILNTDQSFNLGGTGGAFDLYTVFLQESGHAFGLPNNPDTSSVMYTQYLSPRTGLSPGDITNLQALYGVRAPDRFDANQSNGTQGSATPMSFIGNITQLLGLDGTLGTNPTVIAGDLTTLSDVDYYSVSGITLGSFTVSLRTSGISLLKAKVTLLNSWGQVVASATATDPANGDLTLTANQLLSIGTYYIKVEKAASDVFGVGAYRLAVGHSSTQAVDDPIIAGLLSQDYHSNDSPNQATQLQDNHQPQDQRWDYTLRANLSDSSDVDWYSVQSPSSNPGTLVVAVWGITVGGVDPVVTVLDQNKNPVAVQVLTNDGIAYTLQLQSVTANSKYYIGVSSDPATGHRTGNYFIGADFRASSVEMDGVSTATLTQAAPQAATTMTVYQAQLFHFAMSATSTNPQVNSAVRLTIYDADGNEVFSLFTAAGQTTSGDVLLQTGTYTIVFSAGTPDGSSLPDLTFALDELVRTDPIGTKPTNSASSPSGGTSTPPSTGPTTTYNGPYTNPYRPT
jgi:Matrixin